MSAHLAWYGDRSIAFELERRHRKTLEISVLPTGGVRVVAPFSAHLDEVSARVSKRGRWIEAQQRFFAQFEPRTPTRTFVPGETHLYLGRQYRLRVSEDGPQSIKLSRGFLSVQGVRPGDALAVEHLVRAWYVTHAEEQFRRRLEINRQRFADPDKHLPVSVVLRSMPEKWGSMSPRGRLSLNPDLVRAPADAIDYVITHELCHLDVPNHSRQFYDLQNSVIPDWRRRKLRLERALA